MDQAFSLLVVCSANVCRSPYAQGLLKRWVVQSGWTGVIRVTSAGISVYPGDPMCRQAASRLDIDAFSHAASELTAPLLIDADLIVTADRGQRSAAARLVPSCRPRLFTLRQAGALAAAVQRHLDEGLLPAGAPPLPIEPVERLRWLVREFDAARGLLAAVPEAEADIADLHGPGPHDEPLDRVGAAVAELTACFTACLTMP